MEDWIKDLTYIIMPSRYPIKGYEKEYQAAYQCWRAAWEKFRKEIGVDKPLSSDGFLLPHEMGVLFYQGNCIGMTAFTYGSLDGSPVQDLSWWDGWKPEAKEKLKNISPNVVVCSQFTVNPEFAGKGHIVRWKEYISLYTCLRFIDSQADVMAGHLNITRGVNNVAGQSTGATILDENYPFDYYGVQIPAQLVAYEKDKIEAMKIQKGIVQQCEDLWSRKIHLSEFPVIDQATIIPFKKAA